MMQKAGASFLTVHGRTREQRQDQTGSADWTVIKLIKQTVSIPVIANGNINNMSDVNRCLEFTKADAVMSAEGILHNPSLFSEQNVHVCDIVEELLDSCDIYPIEHGHIRSHLYKLLAYCLPQHPDIQEKLSRVNSSSAFREISSVLRTRLDLLQENPVKQTEQNYTETLACNAEYELPVWICHSRPRGLSAPCKEVENLKIQEISEENKRLPKSEKKLLYQLKRIEGQKMRRKRTKEKRQDRKHNQLQADGNPSLECDNVHTSKKEADVNHPKESDRVRISTQDKKKEIRARLERAQCDGMRVCIDLGMEEQMSTKECSKLAQQLGRVYGLNRSATSPVHLIFSGLNKQGYLYQECVRKCKGFDDYLVDIHTEPHTEIFSHPDIVYLSPDSANTLHTLDPEKVYVLGGLVNENEQKGLTQANADKCGIQTAKLPIDEYMQRSSNGTSFKKVLSINQVFAILLSFCECEDWRVALPVGLPPRQGYLPNKPGVDKINIDTQTIETPSPS